MAIGDAFGVYMGSAEVNRQPASGVSEQVSALVKKGTTDKFAMYDGTTVVNIYTNAVRTDITNADAGAVRGNPYNISLIINNTVYLRKTAGTDTFAAQGVQVDA